MGEESVNPADFSSLRIWMRDFAKKLINSREYSVCVNVYLLILVSYDLL